MKNWWLSLGALILLGVLSYGLFVATAPAPLPEGFLYANGHVEGTEVAVSAEVTAVVVESRLQEGMQVTAGDVLVQLEENDFLRRLAVAEAEQAAAQSGAAQRRAELAVWRHHLESTRRDLERAGKLAAQRSLSEQQVRVAEDKVSEARGNVQRLEAAVAQGEAQQRAVAARAALIRRELEKTRVTAPITGTVLTKGIEAGELATPGRVVAVLVDLSQLELRVFVPERDLGKVPIGGEARVAVDAFPERYFPARVSRLDQRAEFTPRDIHMPEERTRMVFGVTLNVNNPEAVLKPGMPVDAWIKWRDDLEWPAALPVPR